MSRPATLISTSAGELTDASAIEGFLSDAYGTNMRIRSDLDRPLLRFSATDAGAFALDRLNQSAVLDFQNEPLNKVVVARMSSARVQRNCAGSDQQYDIGEIFLSSYPHLPYTAHLQPGELTNCAIDLTEIAKVAATAPGRLPEPIRFTGLDPISPAAAAQWWKTRSYAADLLDNPAAAAPLLLAGTAQLLATATLVTFPNTALTEPTIEDRHDAHPASLRRATAFIDDNAHRDISPADIAAAAHVTIRTLQLAFRRHLDTTPTGYLRRVRLSRAHHELQTADPTTGATVSAIAARWGFANHSRFTAEYHAAYGTTPSQTLRR
ncbi:helix-turn-helix domain-containing protein [Actinoplanes sp. TFC3]|uniref:helix-turn-helix domain-containing protein n=1 Tax=Actinoplanes sp. TFC3 TaxID=1710355 RepID=UPI000A85131D|nr:helix-turn-helix domain-containing protein [Actinoplanes sp. TFC3]